MTTLHAVLGGLERASDWLSPIVVKEVRQLARGREFQYQFHVSLVAGLLVAFVGAADALAGNGTAGGWTFGALMACLALLGLAVVPLGAFNALRHERLEQTFDLITLTALSPRRVVVGKLLAQAVKLATLFAGLAPFVAMSFLLGGIDFATILLSMLILFMWSLWMSAACLFVSALPRTRTMSGFTFGGVALLMFLVLVVIGGPGAMFFRGGHGTIAFSPGGGGSTPWWVLAMMTSFWLASLVNLLLLAENRLSLPTGNRVTALRVGFLVQFLLIAIWTVSFINAPEPVRSSAVGALAIFGGLHLALVAIFTVTEELVLPRRVLRSMRDRPAWWRLFAIFLPGGGRGALYVLAQMAVLLGAAKLLQSPMDLFRSLLAMCGYICFYTGVPVVAFRLVKPSQATPIRLRVAVLLLLILTMVVPDVLSYMLEPAVFDMSYSDRHLLDPLRTLSNWGRVEADQNFLIPLVVGLIGLLAYGALIYMGMRTTVQPVPIDPRDSAAAAGAPRNADILY